MGPRYRVMGMARKIATSTAVDRYELPGFIGPGHHAAPVTCAAGGFPAGLG